MPIIFEKTVNNDEYHILIQGRLTALENQEFKTRVLEALMLPVIQEVHIFLDELEYIDSSGIGTLLLLKDKADEHQKHIIFHNPQELVRNIFYTSNFDQYFTIVDDAAENTLGNEHFE